MFGLGFGEIILILVVVLLVFGPEKLPDIARTLGRTMAELRRTVDDVRNELTQPRADFEKELVHRDSSAFRPLDGTCEQDSAPAQPTLPHQGNLEPGADKSPKAVESPKAAISPKAEAPTEQADASAVNPGVDNPKKLP